ncbi:MAG: archaetidylserine decarboxylase [Deltaproteobacteria bacterium]|nr:archaetidylserine decarboxylase [Kofleriaceae bacterium]
MPRPLRAALYGAFARAVDARVEEAANALSEYPSFGDFFARRLRDGARPLAEASVIAPCDGVVAASGPIVDGTLVQAKGRTYSVAELVTLPSLAAALAGGAFVTTYLSPRDYHRVHSPVDGTLVGYHYVPGRRWPVSARFMRNVDRLLAVNERVVIELATAWGPAAVVMVAASGVGNMWLSHLRQPDGAGVGTDTRVWHASGEPRHVSVGRAELAAGDELGSFLLGSTVVMLLPAGAPRLRTLADGDVVRFGQGLVAGREGGVA